MRKKWIKILTFLPLILAIIAVAFMDKKIPIHYDIAGNVDRWGSRYEIFVLPIATFLMAGFLLWMQKFAAKQESQGNNNEKYIDMTIIVCLIIFNVINFLIIYGGLIKLEKLEFKGIGLAQIVLGLTGLLFIFLGNKMPKVKRNSLVGLRTKWSMANDYVWKKSQRSAGIIFIVMGIIFMIFPIIFKLEKAFIYFLIITALCVSAMILSSYIIYKKYGDIEDK